MKCQVGIFTTQKDERSLANLILHKKSAGLKRFVKYNQWGRTVERMAESLALIFAKSCWKKGNERKNIT